MLTIYPNYYNNLAEISSSLEISTVEVGKHLYWRIGAYNIHGQVFIVTWLVMAVL
jgi:F-type H+-transporting ATPase subunit a